MDEEKKNNIMETNTPPETPLTWRDGAAPLLAIGLAWVFWAGFDPVRLGDHGLPHLGVLALVCAHFGAVLVILGRRARLDAGSIFCMAASLALGVSCALYDSEAFSLLNCFVILLVAALGTFALSGHLSPGRARAIPAVIENTFLALFTRVGRPFRALRQLGQNKRRGTAQAALAVLIAVPVVAVVLWLLMSADAVFGSLFARFDLSDLPEDAFMRPLRVLILALFLCSALYYIREEPSKAAPERPDKPRSPALFLPVTVLLDIVYIIFCYVQIKYLFGGSEEASMSGGWAEYARSGFFQLVVITFINLGLFLLGADEKRFAGTAGKVLRGAFGLLLALTAVILVSAFWRMRLYIHAFGMSVLRLLTLWAMAVVLFGLLAAAWKLARPKFGFFRAAGGFALALWCLMNLAGPARMIANYNVDRYLSGALEEMDTYYLETLGPDARAAAEKLAAAGELDPKDLAYWQADLSALWPQQSWSAHRTAQR